MNPTAQYPMNQYAPTYFQGSNVPPDALYDPHPYTYLYVPNAGGVNAGQLTPNQEIIGDSVSIEVDADFVLLGWYCSLYTGTFQIQLIDSSGYLLFSGYFNSAGISQTSSDPTVFSPPHPFPAGGRIQINIQDLSGSTNPVQIAFVGEKLFRRQ
jgi:hypothetical protein